MTYVRPHLEFCTHIFNPTTKKCSDIIEDIQHLATRLICRRKQKTKHLRYEERLNYLNLSQLSDRRTATDLSLLQQVYQGWTQVNPNIPNFPKFAKNLPRHENTRFKLPLIKTKIKQESFLIRSIETFHQLPLPLRLKFSQKNFKGLVLSHLAKRKF